MAQILVQAKIGMSGTSIQRGDPVVVAEDSHIWGSLETLPTFVVLKCPGYTADQLRQYISIWNTVIDHEVLSYTPANATYVVRVFTVNPGVNLKGAITREQAENFLIRWGCSDISSTSNSVQFTLALWQAVQSLGFWSVQSLTGVTFNLDGYEPTTGVATITATFPNQDWVVIATRKIVWRKGFVTNVTTTSVTFTMERTNVLSAFRSECVKQLSKRIYARRYHFVESLIDDAVANGGELEVADVVTQLIDRMTE